MAVVLYIDPDDLGDEPYLYAAQELGNESPLEFYDGHALVQNEAAAEDLVTRRSTIHYAGQHPDADPGYFDETDDGDESDEDEDEAEDAEDFDAAAFVDRTPMGVVVEDIESGEYDEYLDAIEAAEADGPDREGVSDAINERRE